MKFLTSMFALAAACILSMPIPATAQGGGGGDAVGSLPVTYTRNSGDCGGGAGKAEAGQSITNGDGVTASVKSASQGGKGSARVDPKGGKEGCETNASTKSGTVGASISGLDSNDTARIGASNVSASVSGTGGQVHLASNSSVTVTNTSAPGGSNITVHLPGGATATVTPGNSVPFNT